MYVTGSVSILLLILAWRWWLEWGKMGKATMYQGVLLAAVTVGWFLRIVLGPLPGH